MAGPILIDTNILLLIVVGSADRTFIPMHARLRGYTEHDFDCIASLIGAFSDLVLTPNTLTEVSNLSRQIGNPARSLIQVKLRQFVEGAYEIYVESRLSMARGEFVRLGLTDATILHLCSIEDEDLRPTLLSVDEDLLNAAASLGYDCIDYKNLR